MGFPRQEYGSSLPFPSPGDLPHPRIEPESSALQADSLPTALPGQPLDVIIKDRVKESKRASSLAVWWLGLHSFTAMPQVQSLVGELRYHTEQGTAQNQIK